MTIHEKALRSLSNKSYLKAISIIEWINNEGHNNTGHYDFNLETADGYTFTAMRALYKNHVIDRTFEDESGNVRFYAGYNMDPKLGRVDKDLERMLSTSKTKS